MFNDIEETNPMKALGKALAALATREHISEVLGLTEQKPEEFWRIQKFSVASRFFAYIRWMAGESVAQQYHYLSDSEAIHYRDVVQEYLAEGLTYHTIRNWWLSQGAFLNRIEMDAIHEKEYLAELVSRVLVFLESGPPQYLAYDENYRPKLVATAGEAHQFQVLSVRETEKCQAESRAEEFSGLLHMVNGVKLKVRVGKR
jgi:hypothetical protein